MNSEWLTVAEVAALLRLHPETIRRFLRRGELVGHDFGGRGGYRIRRVDLDRFIEGLANTPHPSRRRGESK